MNKESFKSDADEWLARVYLRPIANLFVIRLQNTRIHPVHVTTCSFICSILASYFIYLDQYFYLFLGSILIQLKSIFDALDGQLARARQEYSDIGRFFDSITDFIGDLLIFLALFTILMKHQYFTISCALSVIGFTIVNLGTSFWVYYLNLYLKETGNDYWKNKDINLTPRYSFDLRYPKYFYLTKNLYKLFYKWQDKLIEKLNNVKSKPDIRFVKLTGVLGLGTRLLILSICLFLGRPILFFDFIVYIYLPIFLILIFYRRFYALHHTMF